MAGVAMIPRTGVRSSSPRRRALPACWGRPGRTGPSTRSSSALTADRVRSLPQQTAGGCPPPRRCGRCPRNDRWRLSASRHLAGWCEVQLNAAGRRSGTGALDVHTLPRDATPGDRGLKHQLKLCSRCRPDRPVVPGVSRRARARLREVARPDAAHSGERVRALHRSRPCIRRHPWRCRAGAVLTADRGDPVRDLGRHRHPILRTTHPAARARSPPPQQAGPASRRALTAAVRHATAHQASRRPICARPPGHIANPQPAPHAGDAVPTSTVT